MSVLSSDLISQFVKATMDTTSDTSASTHWGTVVAGGDEELTIQLDGASTTISATTTTEYESGDRVIVQIKDHSAIVTGNVTNTAVTYNTVTTYVGDEIEAVSASFKKVMTNYLEANYITASEIYTTYATIDFANITTAAITSLTASEAFIESLTATYATIDFANITTAAITSLTASEAFIESLTASEAFIESLTASEAFIESLMASEAFIESLMASEAFIESLTATYATIDFANITTASIEKFYAVSGLVQEVTVEDEYVTGTLACVTINADLITAGTLVCDRIALTGEDGLFYYINVNAEGGLTTEAVEEIIESDGVSVFYEGISGSSIVANTITADRINVSDLYAFDATIGGSIIEDGSIHTYAKASIDNTTSGFYLDSAGQFALGNANSYIKFYLDSSSGEYKLDISASEFTYSSSEIITSLLSNYVAYGDYGDVLYDYCVNGDFSDELDSWGIANQSYVFLSSYDDTTCVEITRPSYFIRQKVTFDEDGTVILRLKAACESGYEDSMQIRARIGGTTAYTYLYSDAGEISTEWGEITLTFPDVTAGSCWIYIYSYGVTASLYITDIEILGPYTRTLATTTAELKVTMDEISTSISNVEGDVSTLSQTVDGITTRVSTAEGNITTLTTTAEGLEASIEDTQNNARTYFKADSTSIEISSGTITFSSNTFIVSSTYFSVTSTGVITATSGTIGGFTITSSSIYSGKTSYSDTTNTGIYLSKSGSFIMGGSSYYIQYTGSALNIAGSITTTNGNYKATVTSGNLYCYYSDTLLGRFGATYKSGDTSVLGVAINMEYDCDFMAFGRKTSSSATSFTSFMYFDYTGNFSSDGNKKIHMDESVYVSGYINVEDGYAVRGTIDGGSSYRSMMISSDDGVYVGNSDWVTRIRGSSVYIRGTEYSSSDARLKSNITDLNKSYLSVLDDLVPRSFYYDTDTTSLRAGFIAQEVLEATERAGLDEDVLVRFDDVEGYYLLDYNALIPILVMGYQRLKKRVDLLTTEV